MVAFLDRHLPPVPWAERPGRPPEPDRDAGAAFSPKRLAQNVWRPPRAKRWRRAGRWEVIVSLGLLVAFFLGPWTSSREADVRPDPPAASASPGAGAAVLRSVARGLNAQGELVLQDGTRVRLLGVTLSAFGPQTQGGPPPPNQPVGQGASWRPSSQQTTEAAARLVGGRPVEVEFDPMLPPDWQREQPALMAYVWALDGAGRRTGMLNAQLILLGHAQPTPLGGYAYRDLFVEAAGRARGAGLWDPSAPAPPE